jgi:hypothetical protein
MMKKIKTIVILAFVFSASAAVYSESNIFGLYLSVYRNDSVVVESFEVLEGDVNIESYGTQIYVVKMVSKEGKELFSGDLGLSFTASADRFNEKGEMYSEAVELEKAEPFLRLPFINDVETIKLYHKDKMILDLPVWKTLCASDGKCPEYCAGRNDPDCGGTTTIFETTTRFESTTLISSPTTTNKISTTTQEDTTTTEPVLSTTSPAVSTMPVTGPTTTTTVPPGQAGGLMDYIPYFVILAVLLCILFVVKKKQDEKKIEKEKAEFEKWKQEKGGSTL